MSDKICPLMSRPTQTTGAYDQPITEMHWENCQKENCQLWTQVYTTENLHASGCALVIAVHKTQDGKYAV